MTNGTHCGCDEDQDSTPELPRYAHEVVDTYANIDDFRNAYVTVRDENAVYHVDEVGNPVAVSRSAIFVNNFVALTGSYKQNVVYDFTTGFGYVYDMNGNFKKVSLI